MAEKEFSIKAFRAGEQGAMEWVKKETKQPLKYRALAITNSEVLAMKSVNETFALLKGVRDLFTSYKDIEEFLFGSIEEIAKGIIERDDNQ